MALALLRLDDTDPDHLVLEVDTGTNPFYRIHLGKEVRREQGLHQLGEVLWSSPVQRNPAAGRHIHTRTRHLLDPARVTERGLWVQVESMRDPAGSGPAWSRPVRVLHPVRVPPGVRTPDGWTEPDMTEPFGTRPAGTAGAPSGHPGVRTVRVHSARETFTRPASLDDLLGAVVRIAGPVVADLLRSPGAAPPPAPGAGAGSGAPATGTEQSAAAIAALLRTLLEAAARSEPALAGTSSVDGNRLTRPETARPFIAGIDDALIAAVAAPVISGVIGPLVGALPQLLNTANQARLDRQRESHRHIGEILAQVDRARLLDQLLAAQRTSAADASASPAGGSPDPALDRESLQALISLLQSDARASTPTGTPAPAGPAPAPAAPLAGTASLASGSAASPATPSYPSRAVLGMVTGPALPWQGGTAVLFSRGRAATFRFRLDVPADGPGTAIPRALLRVVIREPGGAQDLLVHQERLTALRPGEVRSVSLPATALDALPADTELDLTAALRWPSARSTRQASCTQRLVLAGAHQLAATGAQAGRPRELVDMARFRPFWHKVWASPASDDEGKGPLWGLDVALRYSVVTTAAPANALMETRVSAEEDPHGLRVSTTGRMKSGVEVSLPELNALLPLWPDEQPLDAATLEAFAARRHLAGQGGDVVHRVRLEGRRHTRGVVWVVPVPTLRSFTVATVAETDAFGQVTAVETRDVRFPTIEAVRVLGLVSSEDAPEPTDAGYAFAGYRVELDELVALEPAVPPATSTAPQVPAPRTAVTSPGGGG